MKEKNLLNEQVGRMKKLMNYNPALNEGDLQAPLSGDLVVTSPYGKKRGYEVHPGVDLSAASGSKILSPADGKIEVAQLNYNPKCGGTIDVKFDNGYWARFCHVKSLSVKQGDTVKKGQVLGLSGGGKTDPGHGLSTGPHLHFTLKKNGSKVNPMDYISKVSSTTSTSTSPTQKPFSFSDLFSSSGKSGQSLQSIKDLFYKILQKIFGN